MIVVMVYLADFVSLACLVYAGLLAGCGIKMSCLWGTQFCGNFSAICHLLYGHASIKQWVSWRGSRSDAHLVMLCLPVGLFLLLWSLASNMPWLLFAPGLGVGAIHSWWCSPASCWDCTIWSSPLFLLPCEFPFLVVNTSLGSFVCFLKQSIVAATLPLWNAV